jgi:hypothetical protein
MQFPEMPRERDDAHVSAVRRLEKAREEQRDLVAAHALAEGTAAEPAAGQAVHVGHADVAAREAWLVWVERGV